MRPKQAGPGGGRAVRWEATIQYIQPYGVSDPNAPYINGNPATGTQGSIPPAASIEYPQREIVALISDGGLTPDNADLTQLAQGVQGGKLNYALDAGTANAYQVTLTPAPTALRAGLVVRMKVGNAPTGPSVLNVNALGAKPMKKRGNKDIQNGDFAANDVIELVYDGAVFFLIGADSVTMLGASLDYYVSNSGSDTLNDGRSPGSPFATIQHAIAVTQSFNLNGYTVNIHATNGVYTGPINAPLMNGSGAVNIIGNETTPSAVQLVSSTGTAIVFYGPGYTMAGFKVSCSGVTAGSGDPGNGVWAHGNNGAVTLRNMEYGSVLAGQVVATDGGSVGLTGNHTISGGGAWHFWCQVNSLIILDPVNPPTWNIPAPVTFSGPFCNVTMLGVWVNKMGTITGYANVTGKKYDAEMNGIISTGGSGINHFPGTVAGTTGTGGQYG
ncbi:hypothetical protein Q3C01_05230 [Bradyrhizobium sp. UFLA05-109]